MQPETPSVEEISGRLQLLTHAMVDVENVLCCVAVVLVRDGDRNRLQAVSSNRTEDDSLPYALLHASAIHKYEVLAPTTEVTQ